MRRWFSMKKTDDTTGEIMIYDEIGRSYWGEDTISAKDFDTELKALGDITQLDLRINSPGGDVFDGVTIHNTIRHHPANVTAYVDGIAASAASYIAMAADKIVMPANSFLLVHGASGFSFGNADDMRAMADDLDRIDQSLTATYANRSGKPVEEVTALMKEDRLMSAEEAKEFGLADEVSAEVKMAANFSLRLLPPAVAVKFKATIKTTAEQEPPPAPAAEEPGPKPETAADPGPVNRGGSAEVINLDAARKEGSESTIAYVNEVNTLCALAGLPALARDFIRASETIENVRAKLIDARAAADEKLQTQHHRAMPTQASREKNTAAWSRVAEQLNARIRK